MATKFIILAMLFLGCSYAAPRRLAAVYGPPLLMVPILIQDLDDPRVTIGEEVVYTLNDDSEIAKDTTTSLVDIKKRSIEESDHHDESDDDDLETAAGTNVLRPLFVYRQQVAYRQRAREAIRRGRRI